MCKSVGRPSTGYRCRSWSYLSPAAHETSVVQEGKIAAEGSLGAHDSAQTGK